MPRVARIAPSGYIYHILTRGNNRQDIFKPEEDYAKFIDMVGSYKDKYAFKLYHYALMPNHVHLVLEPIEEGGSLAEAMKGIKLSYAQYYKKSYRHIGHLRAGIVGSLEDYRWSSYKVYAYGDKGSVIDDTRSTRNYQVSFYSFTSGLGSKSINFEDERYSKWPDLGW
ncbi:MAG: transposase [Deltaproteobacteria bacterium]|nr:MAG: transposase [Deltaproteobacteria bacterium]